MVTEAPARPRTLDAVALPRGRALNFTDAELAQLRRLACDGLRATAFAEFAPRDPKEPPPQPETLARRALCRRILDEISAR